MIAIACLVFCSLILIVQISTWRRLRWISKNMTMPNAIDLTALTAAVTADTDATNAALNLITSFGQQLGALTTQLAQANAAASPTPDQVAAQAAIATLSSQIQTNASALAAAITANTPAAPVATTPAT